MFPRTAGARPTPSGRALRAGAGFLLILYSIVMLGFYRVPYILQEPGSAQNVLGLLRVEEGVDLYKPKGQLLFLTVSFTERLTLLESILGRFQDHTKLIEEEIFTQNRPREEVRLENLRSMQESKLAALKVGLEKLGYQVRTVGRGSLVARIEEGFPADGKLRIGDVIVGVDGKKVQFASEAVGLITGRRPGDRVTLTVQRDGKKRQVKLRTVEDPDEPGRAVMGIQPADNVEFEFPITIDIDTGQVGGPSAGLAFALSVIDELSPGNLTGGKIVAITGTIALDGTVGPVGGVEQKAVAARNAGAVLMLVPQAELEDARKAAAGDMKVRGVSNLDEALEALASIGGDVEALAQFRPAG